MARNLVYNYRTYPREWEFNRSLAEAAMTLHKSYFTDSLTPSNNEDEYKVSAIFRWDGLNNRRGYGWLIRMMDGSGNPTGPEVLVKHMTGDTTGNHVGVPAGLLGLGNSSILNNYYRRSFIPNNNPFDNWTIFEQNTRGAFLFYFSPTSGNGVGTFVGNQVGPDPTAGDATSDQATSLKVGSIQAGTVTGTWIVKATSGLKLEVGDVITSGASQLTITSVTEDSRFNIPFSSFDDMTLSAGEFTDITGSKDPYQDLVTFMPTTQYDPHYGTLVTESNNSNRPYHWWAVIDNRQGSEFVHICATEGRLPRLREMTTVGNIMIPADPTNTNKVMSLVGRVANDTLALQNFFYDIVSVDGVRRQAGVSYVGIPSSEGFPDRGTQLISRRPILVTTSDYVEGYIDPDLVCGTKTFAYAQEILINTPKGPIMQRSMDLAFPWVTGEYQVPPLRFREEN